MSTFDEFITSLERDFGEQGKGKPFEVFCKWFLENDPEWAGVVEKVWLWDDYPNKWQGKDLGTDLVFRDNEGRIWAVQVKCFSQHRSTKKQDLNSFLADAGRAQVHRMLWMQTTDHMEANAEASLKHRDKPVTIFKLTDFRDAQIDYPASFAEMTKASIKPKPTPEAHQIEAIEAATRGLSDKDRGQMIMACGTGKTFTTLWIKEALKAHTTLVLLPSLSLLSQTMREWAWAKKQDFKILNVCSDATVGKKTEDMDPADAPFPVTSDVEEIALFLKKPEEKVIFCTYQSSALIAQAQLDEGVPSFDLAVADEAHRCAGKADAGFSTILDADKIRANKRLFTTATPRYFGKAIKDEANTRDLEVVGMDNEAVFGPVVHRLSFGEAIKRELLTDFQVVIVGVDEPMVREWIEREEIVATDPDSQTDARTLAAKIGLIKAIKDYDLQRVISFHSRVSGAKDFSKELQTIINLVEPEHRPSGTFLSDYVSGEMKAGDRKGKIDRLKALDGFDRGILTNARCLAEGVDVPSLDGVAFIDPKGSQIEIIQAVGRVIRKVRGAKVQKVGTIVIPVFIEDGDDPETSIEASNFKPVWGVLKALRAHDEVFADTLDQYRTNMAKNASQRRESISDKIIFDMPMFVDAEFSSALTTVLVEASTASWQFWFGLLKEFHDIEGHTEVPQHYSTSGGHALGAWVSNQRQLKKTSNLEHSRIEKLAQINFEWDPYDKYWWLNFEKLKIFKQRKSHCRVTKSLSAEVGISYSWIQAQRRHWREGSLKDEYVAALESIGFVQDVNIDLFYEGIENLSEFLQKNSKEDLKNTSILPNGFNLGTWISNKKKNKKNGILPQYQEDILNNLWVDWSEKNDKSFWIGFSELKAFVKKFEHPNVPANFKTNSKLNLGNWCLIQRRAYKRGTLSSEKAQLLEALGFSWNANAAQEERTWLEFLKQYQILTEVEADKKLTQWVNENLDKFKNGELNPQRYFRLNSIGFNWSMVSKTNKIKVEKGNIYKLIEINENLGAYIEKNAHSVVPSNYKTETGFPLGELVKNLRKDKSTLDDSIVQLCDSLEFDWTNDDARWKQSFNRFRNNYPSAKQDNIFWASKQRQSFKDGSLDENRIEKLKKIGFIFEPYSGSWDNHISELKNFSQVNGHVDVSSNYVSMSGCNLGQWVANARTRFNLGKLSHVRILELEELGLVWSKLKDSRKNKLGLFEDFKKEFGHSIVPADHVTSCGTNLGTWVNQQRYLFKKGKLTKYQIDELNSLRFVWDVQSHLWAQNFNELEVYHKREGHCNPIARHNENGVRLGDWVRRQRTQKENLSIERKALLDQLGFIWEDLQGKG